MKIIFIILFLPILSFGQYSEEFVPLKSIPMEIQDQVDVLNYHSTLQIVQGSDTIYQVQTRIKKIATDITYKSNGEIVSIDKPYRVNAHVLGWVAFFGTIVLLISIAVGGGQ